ncbi:MAG: HEPN domain-containing protein [Acidobacteriota bacterium]|nr:HEPN domain-containing protein [Acidobacteriota bacterium]
MKLTLHPQATQNYNKKAEDLVTRLRPVPDRLNRKGGPPNPNIHSVHTFTQEDIIGEIGYGWTDFTGNVVAKAFTEGGQMLGLFDEDYIELIRVAEGMQKSITPRGVVSSQRISDLIFEWVKAKHRGASIPMMTEYVLADCEKLIKELEIWIPISHLYIQRPFVFGRVTFRAITKAMMDEWEASLLSKATTPEEIESVRKGVERHRPQIQGLATATIKVEAEPERASEIAFEEVDRTVSVLRLLSPANIHPSKISYSAPIGRQHEDSYTYLIVESGKIVGYNSGLIDRSRTHWNLTNEDLADWAPELGMLSMLLNKEKLTDFQESFLDALILHSRSSLAKQVSDKLVYIVIALESIFLKDSSELIQDAISLRMAYMHDVSVEKRRAIISNVKAVYKLRSSFIHHGQRISVDETKILTEFMMNAVLSLAALIPLAATEITREEFFNNLENRRLAG